MTTYYVGIGGNDGNAGTSWALRKLTLNGAEDIPVVAGDIVYVGPGVYREMLTVDVSGGAGTEIVYIGDNMGENTDNIGGAVRVTGSDNDQAATRANCITATGFDYRTFRGFQFDTCTSYCVDGTNCDEWVIEDCAFPANADYAINFDGTSVEDTFRRCWFMCYGAIRLAAGAGTANSNHLIENCFCLCRYDTLYMSNYGEITIRNCSFSGAVFNRPAVNAQNVPVGSTIDINNSIIAHNYWGVYSNILGRLVEDYNIFYNNGTDRTNVNVGANSISGNPMDMPARLYSGYQQQSGFKEEWVYGDRAEWSQINQRVGSNIPSIDFFANDRPVTAAKKGWGPIQSQQDEYEDATALTPPCDDVDAVKLKDAGTHLMVGSATSGPITFSIYVYREAGYAGTNPQIVIKQAGVADRVTTDAAGSGTWNLLSDTFSPATTSDVFFIELKSNNTTHPAVNCDVYFACSDFDC